MSVGRTNPTYRDQLRALETDWEAYRRVLRPGERERFDRLFRYGRDHADAAGHLNHRSPVVPLLVSILLAQERRLDALRDCLECPEEWPPDPDPTERGP